MPFSQFVFPNSSELNRKSNGWQDFSRIVKLNYKSGTLATPTRIVGSYRGYFVKIELSALSLFESGEVLSLTTVKFISQHELSSHFSLRRRSIFDKVKSDIDDQLLNRLFIVESQPEGLVDQILKEDDIKKKLIEFRPFLLQLNGHSLIISMDGFEQDASTIMLLMDFLCKIYKIGRETIK